MPGTYLLLILLSLAGLYLIDRKFKIAFDVSRRSTLVTVFVSVAFFLIWDSAGIFMGIFFKGNTNLLLGVDLAPELPLEELFFLTLLSYSVLLAYRLLNKRLSK